MLISHCSFSTRKLEVNSCADFELCLFDAYTCIAFCFVFLTLTRIFRLAVEAKNPPALKELEVKLNAAQGNLSSVLYVCTCLILDIEFLLTCFPDVEEKTEMSNMLGKMKERSIERDLELQQQKDEVSRLKAELEALKEAKAKEIADISSSCSKEIEEARKFYEDRCAKEVAETN